MSWSINFIGNTANVAASLAAQAEALEGQSKDEYVDALPHLVGIVQQNFAEGIETQVKITASGHGYAANGVQKNRQLVVSIEPFYGKVV